MRVAFEHLPDVLLSRAYAPGLTFFYWPSQSFGEALRLGSFDVFLTDPVWIQCIYSGLLRTFAKHLRVQDFTVKAEYLALELHETLASKLVVVETLAVVARSLLRTPVRQMRVYISPNVAT